MKYIVLHREGTEWMNRLGNALHVPFVDASDPANAVEVALAKMGHRHEAPMYLVLGISSEHPSCSLVKPRSGWSVTGLEYS